MEDDENPGRILGTGVNGSDKQFEPTIDTSSLNATQSLRTAFWRNPIFVLSPQLDCIVDANWTLATVMSTVLPLVDFV